MQSASTVQTIAPQTTIDHFQPTGQCLGDLQLPKRRDTGRAQHQAVGSVPNRVDTACGNNQEANRSDIAVAGSSIDRPDQTALSDSEGNAKAEAKRSSIAITTPPGPVSHRTRPHLRVKLCFPACEMFSNVFSPSTCDTSEELLSRIQVFEGLAWCWYSA